MIIPSQKNTKKIKELITIQFRIVTTFRWWEEMGLGGKLHRVSELPKLTMLDFM